MSIGQMVGGRYQLIACLRSSDRETVYLAKDKLGPQRNCVVRQFQLTEGSQRTSRFTALRLKKKAQTLHQLSTCSHLPTILTCFEEANSVYLIEEFIPGVPLSAVTNPGQPLAEAVVVDLMQKILRGLVTIHRWGVSHGQIRPATIIQRPETDMLVLTGFGDFSALVAERSGFALTSPEDRLYTAPDAQDSTRFSRDIYALGILAVQALSGMTVCELSQQLHRDGRLDQRHLPFTWLPSTTLSPQLVTVLQRMIHPDKAYRYQTAAAALDDLRITDSDTSDHKYSRHLVGPSLQSVETSRRRPRFIPWKRIGVWGTGVMIGVSLLGLALNRLPQRLLSQYFLHYAQKTAQQGDLQAAIALSTRALGYAGHSREAYLQRGFAQYRLRDWEAAQADFTRAIAIDARAGKAFYYRGLSREYLGDQQGALLDYTQALALGTNRGQAYLRRGHIRAAVGDALGAIVDYTMAIQTQPDLATAYSGRCLAYLDAAQPESALQDCSQAINLNPGSIVAYQNRSLVRQELGDVEGAIADLTIVLRLDPENADAYREREALAYSRNLPTTD